jgi:hypothetical protein
MVIGFITSYAYHHSTLCDKVMLTCFLLFSQGPLVSSANKTDCHDIAEILLKVALNTIKQTNQRLSRACIVHLVIKRTNSSYVKTMSCSGSHLGIPINIKNTKFVKDLSMIDERSLDGPLQTLGFLFQYKMEDGCHHMS